MSGRIQWASRTMALGAREVCRHHKSATIIAAAFIAFLLTKSIMDKGISLKGRITAISFISSYSLTAMVGILLALGEKTPEALKKMRMNISSQLHALTEELPRLQERLKKAQGDEALRKEIAEKKKMIAKLQGYLVAIKEIASEEIAAIAAAKALDFQTPIPAAAIEQDNEVVEVAEAEPEVAEAEPEVAEAEPVEIPMPKDESSLSAEELVKLNAHRALHDHRPITAEENQTPSAELGHLLKAWQDYSSAQKKQQEMHIIYCQADAKTQAELREAGIAQANLVTSLRHAMISMDMQFENTEKKKKQENNVRN